MEIPLMLTSSLFFLIGVLAFLTDLSAGAATATTTVATATTTVYSTSKLIHRGSGDSGIGDPKDRRILGDKCSKSDIEINQGPTVPLPSGIPTYTVEITNNCLNGCKVSHIHLNCGKFSSATVINPKIFKRLRYNDCLVNDGKPLQNGHTISFNYANTFPYPLPVSSVVCI